ncbi:MAG: hypothetical protein LBN09_01715 [Clostridioides sp.]|nr:hypothetical protein [Clostridioides sp.]
MLNVNDEQRELLLEHLPNAETLFMSDDVNDLLDDLDNLILMIGFNKNYSLNELGRKLQIAYDQIYDQND